MSFKICVKNVTLNATFTLNKYIYRRHIVILKVHLLLRLGYTFSLWCETHSQCRGRSTTSLTSYNITAWNYTCQNSPVSNMPDVSIRKLQVQDLCLEPILLRHGAREPCLSLSCIFVQALVEMHAWHVACSLLVCQASNDLRKQVKAKSPPIDSPGSRHDEHLLRYYDIFVIWSE